MMVPALMVLVWCAAADAPAGGTAGPNNVVRIALMRAVPEKWEVEKNFQVFLRLIETASQQRADVFVTPEGWLDGYAAAHEASTPDKLHTIAQPLESSAYLREVSEQARSRSMMICFGFTSLENGKLYNSAGLWGEDGRLIGVYHKTHLQKHDLQFSPGESLPVWRTRCGILGIMICADRRWPETARTLRLRGARLILNPTYGFHGEFNEAMMRTRSFENQCFIAFAHPSESLVTGPDGKIILKETGETPGVAVCEVDLSRAKNNNHIEDRRPELYGVIAETTVR
ncbi:MAG: nitrilase [Candidatus Hydrogenedentota bacterium]